MYLSGRNVQNIEQTPVTEIVYVDERREMEWGWYGRAMIK